MLCALLVLGLCERHRRSENERLSQDDARRLWLAEEHFVLTRLTGSKDLKEIEDAEPNKGTYVLVIFLVVGGLKFHC